MFSGNDLAGVESDLSDAQPEFPCVTGGTQAVGGFDERLAWHAAAQNAKSADFGRALNDAGFHAEGRGCPGAGIPSAPAADDDKIVGHARS